MKTVQLEVQNNLFDKFMVWIYTQPKKDFNISSVRDINPQYDENGIIYMDSIEQKEIEDILKNKDCHTIGHSKIISLNI